MGLILLRYGEIALKGQNRNFFFRRLRRNVRLCLKANSLEGRVYQEGQRIYLETGDLEAAVAAVRRVFGLVSLSPVHETPAELDAISREAVAVAEKAGLAAGRSYRVRARRSPCSNLRGDDPSSRGPALGYARKGSGLAFQWHRFAGGGLAHDETRVRGDTGAFRRKSSAG